MSQITLGIIGSEELKKDVFNELRMEELDQNNQSKDE